MIKHNFYILSGAMGGGKSAVLSRLKGLGIHCVPEPARAILAEQRRIKAPGVPEQNADLFTMLMLSRAIHNYEQNSATEAPVLFDRGIPDLIAYARLFQLDETPYANAVQEFRYHPTVFYFPAWEEIYTTDAERKMSFEAAKEFGGVVRSIYQKFEYQILEVPRCPLEERVKFILDRMQGNEEGAN
jgi:predicted ATPase